VIISITAVAQCQTHLVFDIKIVKLSVPRVHTTFASRAFSVAAPHYGTHSLLAFTLVLHHIHSVVFLKPTVLIRPSVPPITAHTSASDSAFGRHCAL